MADFQSGQAVSVDYKVESVYNTLPGATGAARFRLTGGGMVPNATAIESPEFRPDLQTMLPRLGLKSGTGGYAGQLSVGTFDPLFEALLRGTWTTNVLEPATTPVNRTFTFEEYREVIGESIRYTGARVSSCRIAMPANAPATVDFGILATDYDIDASKYFTSPTETTSEGLIATDAAVSYDGSPFVTFTSCDFTIDTRAANQAVVGSRLTPDIWTSSMRITGSLSAVRDDSALLTQLFDEDAVPLQFTVTDPSAAISLVILLPTIRLTGLTPGLGADGPEIVTLPFTAGYDASEGSMIKLTRDITP